VPLEKRVRVTPRGLDLDGELLPLLSGEIHYFRHDPSDWPRLLDALVGLGLGLVSTYVPWNVHEVDAGRLDFGESARENDLDRFLDLAAERSLHAVLRPGPHINAELTWLGFPFRVLRDPRAMARTPGGNPVWLPLAPRALPIPSYASSFFLDEACAWLAAVGERIRGRQWPDGPVVMVQIDNEAPLLFRDGPFDQDYSQGALAAYGAFLDSRGRPAAEPPSRFDARSAEDLLPYLEWVEFKERLFADALRRLRGALEGAGVDRVAFSHNETQGGVVHPMWPGSLDAADVVGFDFYHQRRLLGRARGRCRYAAGTCELPWAAELGTGGPWNLPPLRRADTEALALTALSSGLRGCNLFMAADRDRWYGAPIDERGRPRPGPAKRTRAIVEAFGLAAEEGLAPFARVAMVAPRAYARLSVATWGGGPLLPPSIEAFGPGASFGCLEDTLGFEGPIQILWVAAFEGITDALGRAGVGHLVVDGDGVADRLEGHLVAVVPSFELFDRRLWERLLEQVEAGLEVVLGPKLPEIGEDGRALPRPKGLDPERGGELGQGRIVVARLDTTEGVAALSDSLASRKDLLSPTRPAEPGLDVSALMAEDRLAMIGVAELEGRPRASARVAVDGDSSTLIDVMDGSQVDARGGELELELDAYQVRLLRMEPR